MRRPLLALALLAGLATAGTAYAVPAPLVPSTPVTTPFLSSNVTHVGTIPLEGVGVSMEVRKVGSQTRAFVSGAGGLSIYDATDPTRPQLLGHLPVYDWENEDIAVSQDGKTAVLTEFEGTVYLHVVDVSDPALPRIVGSLVPGGSHTVTCADPACGYLYGSEGQTYDIRDRTHPVELPRDQSWGELVKGADGKRLSGHNLHRDAAGYWIADTMPLVVFRQVGGDPLRLVRVTDGTITKGTNYQHNNIRPRADLYRPRKAGDRSTALKDGELLLGNGESNFTGTCQGDAGAFSTWSMVGFDKGAPMKQVDVLRPVSGTYADGDAAVNGLGCSGHWFTQKDAVDGSILVAAAWYEHGTRFLKVDPRTGRIRQVGFFQPVRGSASEAFLMPGKKGQDVVWTVDYHSGIDILRFDEKAAVPTVAQTDASWMAKARVVDSFSAVVRQLCRAGASATPADHDLYHRTATAAFPELTRGPGQGAVTPQ